MNEDRQVRESIAENEAWLRARWVDRGAPDVEAIRRRVDIAIHEQWLADRVGNVAAGPAIDHARRAAQRARFSQKLRRLAHGRGGRAVGGAIGLAAAAVLGWVALLPAIRAGHGDHQRYLDAFDAYVHADSRVDIELAKIEDALFDLELSPVAETVDEWEDSVLDEISDQVDRLWEDGGL